MNDAPPFQITPQITSLLTQIGEAIGRLEILEPTLMTPMLQRKNRIKTLTGTLQIEGSSLDEEKVTAILEGKRVLGSPLELAEVQGAIRAYENLENYRHDRMDDLLSAHRLLMDDILKEAGKFRTVHVGVGGRDGVSHVAPPYDRVPGLMENLFTWLKTTDAHPLIAGCVFHYEFEFIHPFSDGNGRMGRLWQTVILSHWKKLFASVPVESMVRERQEAYYRALEESGSKGESTPFIEFMLTVILDTLKRVGEKGGEKVGENLTKNQQLILAAIKDNSRISARELAEIVGISSRKIEENIAKLKKLGVLKRVGGARGGYWEVRG